ncbi:hypothetical protein KAJ89_01235 [Candidatus Parcubacteria bacterium]|nr:hypothetical protein [Candidatus Parcubacteria bacterium]
MADEKATSVKDKGKGKEKGEGITMMGNVQVIRSTCEIHGSSDDLHQLLGT